MLTRRVRACLRMLVRASCATRKRAISTALGYNQLLNANTMNLLAEQGDLFVKTLRQKAHRLDGSARAALDRKIAILQRMVALSKTVPNSWSEHVKLGNTPPGLGVLSSLEKCA